MAASAIFANTADEVQPKCARGNRHKVHRMSRPFYHTHPETMSVESEIVNAKPGRVVLAQSPFYPGGGGQLPDKGVIRWSGGEVAVTGFESNGGQTWALLAGQVEPAGSVEAVVDADFRQMMRELHTNTHLLNAFVYQQFDGALVTGVQMNPDGTARMDFDLRDADNDRLRALDGPINDAIRQDLPVGDSYVAMDVAIAEPGLIRTRSVAPPPTPDGKIRIVEIAGLDRQACGGTHLGSTGRSRLVQVRKIDNKGRHNRRVKIGLVGLTPGT
ncbi:alanyl-tRNA editing protein [Bradyrhizobium sp. SZCCHNR2032]|uniref:alanyl-tRNA editing protein n=1 Tax=Bradyrhizobium sp. SZCCHNR2032 TaxID=3057384 RepID=UPI002916EC01|nr:alanyl-tRNA editing protein [Bradyrhizobium sp. SZCCHNR2032]